MNLRVPTQLGLDQGLNGGPLACTETSPDGRGLLLATDQFDLEVLVAKRPEATDVRRRSNAFNKPEHRAHARDLQRLAR